MSAMVERSGKVGEDMISLNVTLQQDKSGLKTKKRKGRKNYNSTKRKEKERKEKMFEVKKRKGRVFQ